MDLPYSVAAVSRLTGVSIDTLRAWERRHAVVSPKRDARGVRRYSQKEVARLKLLSDATKLGHSIGQIADLSDDQLRSIVATQVGEEVARNGESPVVAHVLRCLQCYDVSRAEGLLARAAIMAAPQDFLLKIVSPLMNRVGRQWERGQLSIAQEHLISALIRNLLGSLMRLQPAGRGEPILFATPPGDEHEFGIIMAACLASMRSIRTFMLGPNAPVKEIVEAAERLRPRIVVVGSMLKQNDRTFDRYVAALKTKLPGGTRLWLGGTAARANSARCDIECVATLTDYCKLLDLSVR